MRSRKKIAILIQDSLEAEQKAPEDMEAKEKKKMKHYPKVQSKNTLNNFKSYIPLPFSSRLIRPKKEEWDKEILEIFTKVEVNIPLLDAIR